MRQLRLQRPTCCTLQGEDFFINGLVEPYRDRALALIRRQVLEVDRFIAVSRHCAAFISSFLQIPVDRVAVIPLVDKMWRPMASLRPPDKQPMPAWNGCAPADVATNNVNELFLPDGHRP